MTMPAEDPARKLATAPAEGATAVTTTRKNLLEAMTGVRFEASKYWDPHPLVGLSALCLGVPAPCFLSVELCVLRHVPGPYSWATLFHLLVYPVLMLLLFGAVFTCLLADFLYVRRGYRSFYGKVDVMWATCLFFLCVFDFGLRASLLETFALTGTSVLAFAFSGSSPSFEAWVLRHSLWHFAAGAICTYGALRLPPEEGRISEYIWRYVAVSEAAYLLGAAALLAAFRLFVSEAKRQALWERGAPYANWKPVVQQLPPLEAADGDGSSYTRIIVN